MIRTLTTAAAVALALTACATAGPTDGAAGAGAGDATAPLLVERFAVADGLVTNEWATWHPDDDRARRSPRWTMTSGSLFAEAGAGWTGAPDGGSPDRLSQRATGSAVFRMRSRRADVGDAAVVGRFRVDRFTSTARTPAVAWDGIHLWTRYRSAQELYVGSVARRDGSVAIKKKCPGGDENGGTYLTLADGDGTAPRGRWFEAALVATDHADGSVTLRLLVDGTELLAVRDTGSGCGPLAGTGAVGVRIDNAEVRLDDLVVRPARTGRTHTVTSAS